LSAATAARRPQTASTNTLGAVKQIHAGVVNVGFAELGPAQGGVVGLLHGWPYDIHSYADVAGSLGRQMVFGLCPSRTRMAL